MAALFRGDERAPQKMFAKGFTARGRHFDVIKHVCKTNGNFVSTSYDYKVAKRFPAVPNPEIIYIYEINPQREAININELIKPAEKAGKLKVGGYKYFAPECEMLIPQSIKPQDIKAAWGIKVTYPVAETTGKVTQVRTLISYAPNPNYWPSTFECFLPSTSLLVTRLAIHGLSTVGLAIDAYSLYSLFKFGEVTGNYNPFLREGARISGGIAGAINLGTMFAQYGANVGKAFGLYGLAVGGVVSGAAGSLIGYYGGGRLATALFDSKVMLKGTFDRPISYPGALMTLCHSSQRARYPMSITEERYVRAIFGGIKKGIVKAGVQILDHANHMIFNPVDYICNRLALAITKMSIKGIRSTNAFMYDATIIGVGSAEDSRYFTFDDFADFALLQHHIKSNPKLYHDALARVDGVIRGIQDLAQKIMDADGPECTEMGVEFAFDVATMCFFKSTRALVVSKVLSTQPAKSTLQDKVSGNLKSKFKSTVKTYADVVPREVPSVVDEISRATAQAEPELCSAVPATRQVALGSKSSAIIITGRRSIPITPFASTAKSQIISSLMQASSVSDSSTISPILQLSTLTPAGIYQSLTVRTSAVSSREFIAETASLMQSLVERSSAQAHTQPLLQAARSSAAVSLPHVPSALEGLGYSRPSGMASAGAVLFAHRPSVVSAITTRVNPASAVPSALSAIGMGPYTISQAAASFLAPRDTHAARLFSRAEFHSANRR